MTLLLKVIKFLGWYILTWIILRIIEMLYITSQHAKEKHVCNNCKVAFTKNYHELTYEYCPYCGEPLDYHEEDERSRSYKGEEK